MGTINNYNWKTEFKTSENLMIHTLVNGIKVVVLLMLNSVEVYSSDNRLIKSSIVDGDWTVEKHAEYLCKLSEKYLKNGGDQ